MSETTTQQSASQGSDQSACCSKKGRQRTTYLPSFDVWRNAERLILQGDVPGARAEDLNIRLEEGKLLLSASVESRLPQNGVLRREYGVGDFEREFAVGETVDPEAVSATLVDGVLTIELPIAAKAQPHRVEVRTP